MSNTRRSIIEMVKSGNLAALVDTKEEIEKLEQAKVPGHEGGKCVALPVLKSQQRTNKQVMGNQETMINLLLNGGGGNGGNKDTLRIPTPLGKPIEVPGERIRDATRLIAILALVWLAWHVFQMKQEQQEQREELRSIGLPRVAAVRDKLKEVVDE